MDRASWEKAKEIFERAMTLPAAERGEFLEKACGGDPEVEREVAELLVSMDETVDFLESPAISLEVKKIAPGGRLAHYEILEPLGAGGMGEVFLARDTRLRRRAAIKVISAGWLTDAEKRRRFEREALAASALNHPNILTIYEIGAEDGVDFIAAEFVEGATLRELLGRGDLSFGEILDVAVQTVSAIAAAHAAGIVHRDVKPENIMIRPDKLVKVLDFGLAKTLDGTNPADLTDETTGRGVILGTVAYMSPEQARGRPVDARTDLWSFGVVLYEMLAGRPPFAGETPSDTIAAILKNQPELPETGTPPELERIVLKLLGKEPDERYQTAAELLVDLKNIKSDLETGRRPVFSTDRRDKLPTAGKIDEKAAPTADGSGSGFFKSRIATFAVAGLLLAAGIGLPAYLFVERRPAVVSTVAAAPESLAVLPFESANPENEYLSDGVTESLIDSLANLPKLRVTSRNTVYGFKNSGKSPAEIGKALNVRAVLTGRIEQTGDRLTVQAELVDLSSNSQLWGERFDVAMSEIFSVEERIARQIADRLQIRLDERQRAEIGRHYTENAEAYREYLKGRYYTLKFSPDGHQKALEHLHRAIEIDPTYALAYAGIADAYTTVSDTFMAPRDALAKAKAAADRALALDDGLAEAYAARGHARLHEWDRAALDDLERAAALAPNSLTTQLWLGEYYMIWNVPKSVEVLQHAADLDPLSPVPLAFLSFDFYLLKQNDLALETGLKTRDLAPVMFTEQIYIARIYLGKGDLKAAEKELDAYPAIDRDPMALSTRAMLYAAQNKPSEAEKVVGRMRKLAAEQYVSPYEFALVYLKLGDRDRMFRYLDQAANDRSENLGFIRSLPDFDPVRADPRYAELLRKTGLDSAN
ncbi:MAG: protein kinase [Acidobacteria bacterium]|nr:protein kinase [Acidobacteriota bacterium]